MSAPLYTSMPPPPRRHPLAAAANHYAVNQQQPRHAPPPAPGTPPPKQQEQPKQPASPPLPRQNAKVTPPSPPKIITDKSRSLEFMRVGMLGELYAEIKIHKSLEHPNIVRFQDCFEDEDNVYMTLELCHNGSLMDMLRRRRRFTEPEARFFMVQLIGACQYMHTHQVIHRDLKLGNIFLDKHMNVKVGDFGLAALIEIPGERKKTICGTPNYIAPEVLFDQANGHSFEVDTWSIGVILYTLVVGRPPFQTKDVKTIYKRIRDNEYEFPADRAVSKPVQELIQAILTPDPAQRPTLHDIVAHAWFSAGTVPGYIPTSAHDAPPDFRHISRHMPRPSPVLGGGGGAAGMGMGMGMGSGMGMGGGMGGRAGRGPTASLAQQEKEFQKAIQPGSPISALLSSARQPLIVAPQAQNMNGGPRGGEQPLLRKLQAAKEASASAGGVKSPPGRAGKAAAGMGMGRGLHEIAEEVAGAGMVEDEYGARVEELRKKELESQKARIVAQMVPVPGSAPGSVFDGGRGEEMDDGMDAERDRDRDRENVPPARTRDAARLMRERAKEREREKGKEKGKERAREDRDRDHEQVVDLREEMPGPVGSGLPLRVNGFDAAAQTLTKAFEAKAQGRLFRDPREDVDLEDPRVFIVSWVDYCNKYGMGYALTDGSVGVHFNDSSTVVLSADKQHFDYISSRRQGAVYVRKNYTVSEYPEDLKNKVYLLKHFERYIMDRLYGDYEYTYEDQERTKGMDFVQKYLRMKHVIVFKMSHDVLQFNFYDHSKVILSAHGLLVTHIDKNYTLTRHSLAEVMARALRPPVADPDEAKFNQRLVDKLKYCKEVLVSIRNASQGQGAASEMGDTENLAAPVAAPAPAPAPARSVASRNSKISLR
ncbi:transporter [Ganoderma sinense ZZ0214-1]|uniref:Transporter n=1 Tax=Ganoderma sinense ZZ0214-1 TaxID=1077348 RepID=A0A2G8S8X9_9APHY|nr:transporter [Ganoderma sinense ZZ0214-1]